MTTLGFLLNILEDGLKYNILDAHTAMIDEGIITKDFDFTDIEYFPLANYKVDDIDVREEYDGICIIICKD